MPQQITEKPHSRTLRERIRSLLLEPGVHLLRAVPSASLMRLLLYIWFAQQN